MEEQKQRLMSQVPKTAAGFNRDFKALKKDTTEQLAYLKRIPSATLRSYFVKTELETETFSEMLRTLDDKISAGSSSNDDECNWAYTFMMDLSKSFKFDMTIMFAEDEENGYIRNIVSKIREVDATKADQVQQAFDG